jgi:hypothetical protein
MITIEKESVAVAVVLDTGAIDHRLFPRKQTFLPPRSEFEASTVCAALDRD